MRDYVDSRQQRARAAPSIISPTSARGMGLNLDRLRRAIALTITRARFREGAYVRRSEHCAYDGIHAKLGATIAAACKMSSAQPDFLAALIANESGGDSNAKRFERGVLDSLWSVLMGRSAHFGSIGLQDISSLMSDRWHPRRTVMSLNAWIPWQRHGA